MIAAALALAFAAPTDPVCAAAFERVRVEGAVEAVFVAHVAYARADVGDGTSRWFLIDTGANRSALDAGVARALNLPDETGSEVEGTAGVVRVGGTTLERFTLGGLTTRLSPTVSDLSGLVGPNGEPVAGILGSDAFGRSVLVLDFQRNRVAIAPANQASRIAAACGRGVAMRDDNGIPRIDAEIDGEAVSLRYDSGASIFDSPFMWVNLSQGQFDAVQGDRPPAPPIQTLSGSGVGGSVPLPVHKGSTFRLGELEWCEPRLIVQPRQGYFARETAVGFIGNAAFRPFGLVVVDYPGGRLTVPPADRP
ncbi:MAG: aspartyl protease family protein [Brevundimonas sp.]